jgi:hypothetical protein
LLCGSRTCFAQTLANPKENKFFGCGEGVVLRIADRGSEFNIATNRIIIIFGCFWSMAVSQSELEPILGLGKRIGVTQ